jgi:4,5-DOPA dioxygenase extradiol
MNNHYPTLFVPHGAPDFALNSGQAGTAMHQFAQTLKSPRAILIISTHWNTADITVGTAPFPQTIHDFWGFDEKLYTIQYPVKNHLSLHNTVIHQLHQNGLTVKTDQHHGLDHGAWIPLRIMFPKADIPVIPISIQSHQNPEYHFKIGQALSNLTQEGFLIICSGNLTHNLRDYHIAARRNNI